MKKYILNLLFVFISVLAYATPEDPYAHLGIYESMDKAFLEHLVYGKEITYQVCTHPLSEYNEDNHTHFLNALNIWLNTTEQYILERENGKKDFADILKILKNVKNLKRLPCKYDLVDDYLAIQLNSDLNVLFTFHQEDEEEIGYYNHKYNSMAINKYVEGEDLIYGIDDMPIILHELGHVFGLADRYSGALHDGSFVYNSLTVRPSVMMDYNTITEEITCDDVDGLITSIDRIRPKKRTFKSFCNDDTVLVNGTAQKLKPGYVYNYKEGFSYHNANYDANISVIYDKESVYKKSYILDITLENFEKAPGSIELIESLGFDTKDIDLTQNIKVRIHAPVQETRGGYKFPIGLTNIFLTVNGKQKQAVITNYRKNLGQYLRFFYDSYEFKKVEDFIILPIMHYTPDYKHKNVEEQIIIIIDESLEELLKNIDIK